MSVVKHTNGAQLTDMQGNTASILTDKSAQDGKLIAWGIDRVMMSGACRLYSCRHDDAVPAVRC
jgi:hypothetical protein